MLGKLVTKVSLSNAENLGKLKNKSSTRPVPLLLRERDDEKCRKNEVAAKKKEECSMQRHEQIEKMHFMLATPASASATLFLSQSQSQSGSAVDSAEL